MIWIALFFHVLFNNLLQLCKIPVYKLTRTCYSVNKMTHGIIVVKEQANG